LFTQLSGLQLHSRIHSREKAYSCLTCTKSFSKSDQLKHHINSDTCKILHIVKIKT
jgi:uncharacterized Zn-finger protein